MCVCVCGREHSSRCSRCVIPKSTVKFKGYAFSAIKADRQGNLPSILFLICGPGMMTFSGSICAWHVGGRVEVGGVGVCEYEEKPFTHKANSNGKLTS